MLNNELKKVNEDLIKYIESNIFPEYEKNDKGHRIDHIKTVLKRSFKFAEQVENINYDMVYTIASYHDVSHHIDRKNHEKLSAEMLAKDANLLSFFTKEQIEIMANAVEDHRASSKSEPRNIYGKIVSTADRTADINMPLKRTYEYTLTHFPEMSLEENIERSYLHIKEKFGEQGYAVDKVYFKDEEYELFLSQIRELTKDIETFRKEFLRVNKLD